MNFELSEEQNILRNSIIKFAESELNQDVQRRDHDHAFDRGLWKKCADIGVLGLPIPEKYGGSGVDPVTTAVSLEALGYGCKDGGLNFSICAHLLGCAIPIWKHGSDEQKDAFLPGLCDGSLISVNAMTEAETGSDSFAMNTRAEACEEGYRINGTKTFCSNGPVADLALVYAISDKEKGYHGGVTAFLVPKKSSGFNVGQTFDKMGLRTSPISELIFEDVVVPQEYVLGGIGGGSIVFADAMNWERALLVACHVGTMERLLDVTVEYARTRRQYDQTIGKFQAVSHRIADMKVRLEASRLLTYAAASGLEITRAVGRDAAIAKLYTSEALIQTTHDAVQIMGGYGFMTENDVERSLRDAVASTIYSGTSDVQRNIIARWLRL
ncbi:MAG: acyl-CoA dehydrogenase family protein [Halioglobus sp.]|nr:acyl-CoA dehydrogenase family protein [Halioglobus sp.]